jgi:hypothetical protein
MGADADNDGDDVADQCGCWLSSTRLPDTIRP